MADRQYDTPKPTKPCRICGREIEWRKKWERDWEQVLYCSDKCKRYTPRSDEQGLEEAIMLLLVQRGRGGTICPSEVAQMVLPALASEAAGKERWRDLLEPVRMAARRLVASGRVEVLQGGKVVDASRAKGAIRVRLA